MVDATTQLGAVRVPSRVDRVELGSRIVGVAESHPSDGPGGHAGDDGPRGDVFAHHGAGADHRFVTDGDAHHHDGVRADEDSVSDRDRLAFDLVLAECTSRMEVIVSFLAILELLRTGRMVATQDETFGPIWLAAASPEEWLPVERAEPVGGDT